MPDDDMPIPGRTYQAWAIWNSCQGVFTDAVFHWRSEANDALATYGPGAKVVPVTIGVDPAENWDRRHWDQDEWERVHKRGKFAEPSKPDWHGKHLTEDEIVADMLAKIKADAEGVKRWADPWSWKMPLGEGGKVDPDAPEHAGCLMFAGMQVRNYYGLWRDDCPHTMANGAGLEITDGVITDPRHPDNFSGRIIERVRGALGAQP